MAEQVVEVPTVVSSSSSLQQLDVEQIVDIPVLGGVEVFKVSLDRIQQRFLELIVLTFQFRGGLQGSCRGQGSAASSSHAGSADDAGLGFFHTFLRGKKVRGLVRTRGRN